MKEQGLDAVFVQNRGITAPADIPPDARKVLEEAFFKYTQTRRSRGTARTNMLSEAWMDGDDLRTLARAGERQVCRHLSPTWMSSRRRNS